MTEAGANALVLSVHRFTIQQQRQPVGIPRPVFPKSPEEQTAMSAHFASLMKPTS